RRTATQGVRQRADVVLVRVGDKVRAHSLAGGLEPREVGDEQLYAGRLELGELGATVDDHHRSHARRVGRALVDGHVAAEGATAAERDHAHRPRPRGRRGTACGRSFRLGRHRRGYDSRPKGRLNMDVQEVVVLGAGSWGTALAKTLADKGHRVTLWG